MTKSGNLSGNGRKRAESSISRSLSDYAPPLDSKFSPPASLLIPNPSSIFYSSIQAVRHVHTARSCQSSIATSQSDTYLTLSKDLEVSHIIQKGEYPKSSKYSPPRQLRSLKSPLNSAYYLPPSHHPHRQTQKPPLSPFEQSNNTQPSLLLISQLTTLRSFTRTSCCEDQLRIILTLDIPKIVTFDDLLRISHVNLTCIHIHVKALHVSSPPHLISHLSQEVV